MAYHSLLSGDDRPQLREHKNSLSCSLNNQHQLCIFHPFPTYRAFLLFRPYSPLCSIYQRPIRAVRCNLLRDLKQSVLIMNQQKSKAGGGLSRIAPVYCRQIYRHYKDALPDYFTPICSTLLNVVDLPCADAIRVVL